MEDLVQESILRAFRSFDAVEDAEAARSWVLAIVRNTCYTFLRKKGAWPASEFDEQLHAPDPAPDPEVVILRELEELPYKEISVIARVPLGTVMSRLARGRKRPQDCLAGVFA